MAKLAVVLLSGGPDALVAAATVRAEGYELAAMFVDYGQRTARRERNSFEQCAAWLTVRQRLVVRSDIYRQTSSAPMLKTGRGVDGTRPVSEYVPFRNTLLAANAVVWAGSVGAGAIVLGSTGSDRTSPDNTPAYLSALQRVIDLGTLEASIHVMAPMVSRTKAQVVAAGEKLSVPFGVTWSCQNTEDYPCAACNNCHARQAAFAEAAIVDPLSL